MISTFLELKNPLKNATNIFLPRNLKLLTKSFVFKKVSKVVVKKQGQVAKLNIFKVEKCTLSFKFATFLRVLTMLTFWVAFQGGRHFYKEPHYLKSSVIPLLALARRSWKAGSAAVLLLEKAFRGHGLMQLKLYLSCDLFWEIFFDSPEFCFGIKLKTGDLARFFGSRR